MKQIFRFGIKQYVSSTPLVRPATVSHAITHSAGSKWMGGKRQHVRLGRLHSAPKPTK